MTDQKHLEQTIEGERRIVTILFLARRGVREAPRQPVGNRSYMQRKLMNRPLALLLTAVLAACQVIPQTPLPSPIVVLPEDTATAPATSVPTTTPLPPTETIAVIETSTLLVSVTPTIISLEQGITWTECIAPVKDYAKHMPDDEFALHCLGSERPVFDDKDRSVMGERIEGSNGSDLKQVIGNDVYLVKHDGTNGCCDYQLLKNGSVLLSTHASLITFDPNVNLWNFGGRLVWELITDPPTIIVDGVDFNQKYKLEGIFQPYLIKDKLLYIAKKDGKYHIVYAEEVIGPDFDEIYIKYCCATTKVNYGGGRYRFWGRRGDTYYVVEIQ
jgi:hypothetical protein